MAIRNLTFALAAAAMTVGTTAQAAAPLAVPARSGASVDDSEHLGGMAIGAVAVFMLAVLALMIFDRGDDDVPNSP
jgi:hypothetical protein